MKQLKNPIENIKIVSNQSENVYRLLLSEGEMTAAQIADELDVLPNAIYRVTNKLIKLGLVQKSDSYPVIYKANKVNTAMNWYLLSVAQSFRNEFGNENIKQNTETNASITLIKDRDTLLSRSNGDAIRCNKSIDFIVSGHEVPDELVFSYRKMIVKGVKVRGIIHQKGQLKGSQVKIWKDIGVGVKYLPDFNMRIIIYDKRIVYLTSFDSQNSSKAFGVRFEYATLGFHMSELFEQNWQKARKI